MKRLRGIAVAVLLAFVMAMVAPIAVTPAYACDDQIIMVKAQRVNPDGTLGAIFWGSGSEVGGPGLFALGMGLFIGGALIYEWLTSDPPPDPIEMGFEGIHAVCHVM